VGARGSADSGVFAVPGRPAQFSSQFAGIACCDFAGRRAVPIHRHPGTCRGRFSEKPRGIPEADLQALSGPVVPRTAAGELGRTTGISRLQSSLTPVPVVFHSVLTQVSRGATDDSNRTPSQTVNVVPNGPRQMDERVAGQQSLQPGAVESGEKRTVQDSFPAHPLAGSREILQMLRLGMHDVEMGRSRSEDGILRVGRQPTPELVFRLAFQPLTATRSGAQHAPPAHLIFVPPQTMCEIDQDCVKTAFCSDLAGALALAPTETRARVAGRAGGAFGSSKAHMRNGSLKASTVRVPGASGIPRPAVIDRILTLHNALVPHCGPAKLKITRIGQCLALAFKP
jgi:hypothetical protein